MGKFISVKSFLSKPAEAAAALDTSDSLLLESLELVELAPGEPLPHLVCRPRQDLELASDQASGSQTRLESVWVFAAGNAECDAHVVDVPVEMAHEDDPSVLDGEKSVGVSLECHLWEEESGY